MSELENLHGWLSESNDISFRIACRDCLDADRARTLTKIEDESGRKWENMTEYEAQIKINTLLHQYGKTCKSCGSDDIVALDIEVNGKPLYEFESIVKECRSSDKTIIIFNISKNNDNVSTNLSGASQFGRQFAECAVNVAINKVKNIPKGRFKPRKRGEFVLVMTGPDTNNTWDYNLQIERLKNTGMSFREVKHGMIELVKNFGININP